MKPEQATNQPSRESAARSQRRQSGIKARVHLSLDTTTSSPRQRQPPRRLHRSPRTMNAKVVLLLSLVAAAAAEGSRSRENSYGSHGSGSDESKYDFSYQVKDDYGNDFGHRENRDGDYTEGFYYNLLPDGRLQKVKYEVDGYSGFVADVSYEGEAHYDSGSYESRGSGSREYYRPRYYRGYDSNESK
ncbi:pro-resilin-like [Portunus trituberculatus]|uniref:pro-resilin-like n=1 Tax=Portunus trituberculatus TaxID=210409 RepID=UPI001E1CBF43|nr:pro-resilin-like [Portunus trituberculatus]